jgi:hypothetical protein
MALGDGKINTRSYLYGINHVLPWRSYAKEHMPQPAKKKAKAEPTFDPTAKLTVDPDEFLAQEARRKKNMRMQDLVRPGRTTPIAVRFDQFTLKRLKSLAALRNTGYQTLLKEFIVERLYEEEKREGIIKS